MKKPKDLRAEISFAIVIVVFFLSDGKQGKSLNPELSQTLILCGDLNTSLKIFQQTACKCMQFFLKGVLQAKCLCNTFQENREFFFAIQKEFYSFPMLIPRFFLLHAAGML